MNVRPNKTFLGRAYRQRNLHNQVVNEIGGSIVRGVLKPSDVLPDEGTMSGQLGVSRTVVREAIKVLAAKGLVETRTRRGTIVLPDTYWNRLDPDVLTWIDLAGQDESFLKQLTEIRKIVEPAAAGMAAERATAEEMQEIQRAFEDMQRNTEQGQNYTEADMRFHAAILEASHNAFLKPLANAIRAALHASMKVTDPNAHRDQSLPLHRDILEAIRKRDAKAAAEAMRLHLDYTWQRIQKELEENS